MRVGEMRMLVLHRLVAMTMSMRLRPFVSLVDVLVMQIVNVPVLVLQRVVVVLMLVPLRQD